MVFSKPQPLVSIGVLIGLVAAYTRASPTPQRPNAVGDSLIKAEFAHFIVRTLSFTATVTNVTLLYLVFVQTLRGVLAIQ